MSLPSLKSYCKPLPANHIHKTLCTKYTPERLEVELTEGFDKYRDENLKNYKEKCEEFLACAKKYHDKNYKDLSKIKFRGKKIEEYYNHQKYIEICDSLNYPGSKKSEDKSFLYIEEPPPKHIGKVYRRRCSRSFDQKIPTELVKCEIEPWFKRYLVLSRFIEVARRIIIKNRLLKRLEIFKQLKCLKIQNPEILVDKELEIEYLSYPELSKQLQSLITSSTSTVATYTHDLDTNIDQKLKEIYT